MNIFLWINEFWILGKLYKLLNHPSDVVGDFVLSDAEWHAFHPTQTELDGDSKPEPPLLTNR